MQRVLTCCVLAALFTLAVSDPFVRLIIDTDMAFDVDDVGAVCIANALMHRNETELVAVVHDTGLPQGVGAVSVLNHFYGHDGVAIGAFKGEFAKNVPGKYVLDLVENYPSPIKNYTQVPDAVDVYRSVLVRQPDHSVVISSIGFMTNLARLLESPPDHHSPLSGHDLVAAKVRMVAWMGGQYPHSDPSEGEFNFACAAHLMGPADDCLGTSKVAVDRMPRSVRLVFSGFEVGSKVHTAAPLSSCATDANPCRRAYIDLAGKGNNHDSWDPLTTLYAVRGAQAVGCTETSLSLGHNVVNGTTGANHWSAPGDRNQQYLLLNDAQTAADAINELLCDHP